MGGGRTEGNEDEVESLLLLTGEVVRDDEGRQDVEADADGEDVGWK